MLPRLSDGAYDLVFCDADPASYPEYLTAGLRLLRPGGIVVCNDALSAGPGPAEDGIRELTDMIRIDERLVPLLLPSRAACSPLSKSRQSPATTQPVTAALPDGRLQGVTELRGLVNRQLHNGLPPPSNGTRITIPRPSLVTSSGPSPVRGFIAAIPHPLPSAPAHHTSGPRGAALARPGGRHERRPHRAART